MLEEFGIVAESIIIVVSHFQTVVSNASNHRFVAVDSIKVFAELTACVSERMFGDSVPKSVFGIC